MSSHGVTFLDLREIDRSIRHEQLESEVRLLTRGESLVVILDHDPSPLFDVVEEGHNDHEESAFCFSTHQVQYDIHVASITLVSSDQQNSGGEVPYGGNYSAIFRGLPIQTE
ncbi:MAG: DUF2249 domain-containing protein [bacterium]